VLYFEERLIKCLLDWVVVVMDQKVYELQRRSGRRRGLPSLEKAQGLGPCSAGIRGFKSLPPHFLWIFGILRRNSSPFIRVTREWNATRLTNVHIFCRVDCSKNAAGVII
jgi:hypothetical protein